MKASEISGKKPKFFNSAIAENGDKNSIAATGTDEQVSQSLGFGNKFSTPRDQQGKSVSRRDMNGLFNDVSSLNYYFQYMGTNPWSNSISYPRYATVFHETGVWISQIDDNLNHAPKASETYWKLIYDLNGPSVVIPTVDLTDVWSAIYSLETDFQSKIYDINVKIAELSGYITSGTPGPGPTPPPTPVSVGVTELDKDGTMSDMTLSNFYTKNNGVEIWCNVTFLSIDESVYHKHSAYDTKTHPFLLFGTGTNSSIGFWHDDTSSCVTFNGSSRRSAVVVDWTFTDTPFWIGVRWDSDSVESSGGYYHASKIGVTSDIDTMLWKNVSWNTMDSPLTYNNLLTFYPLCGSSVKWHEIRVHDLSTDTWTSILPYKTDTSVYWKVSGSDTIVNVTSLGSTFT